MIYYMQNKQRKHTIVLTQLDPSFSTSHSYTLGCLLKAVLCTVGLGCVAAPLTFAH